MSSPTPTGGRWKYDWAWVRSKNEDDADVDQHLAERARDGWELVSAAPVWLMSVYTEYYGADTVTKSQGTMRQYFYWRKWVEADPPADDAAAKP